MNSKILRNIWQIDFAYINEYGMLSGRSYDVSIETSFDTAITLVKGSIESLSDKLSNVVYIVNGVSKVQVIGIDNDDMPLSIDFYPRKKSDIDLTNLFSEAAPIKIVTDNITITTYLKYIAFADVDDNITLSFDNRMQSSIEEKIKTSINENDEYVNILSVDLSNNNSRVDNLYLSFYNHVGVYFIEEIQEYRITGYTSAVSTPKTFAHRAIVETLNNTFFINEDSVEEIDGEYYIDGSNFGLIECNNVLAKQFIFVEPSKFAFELYVSGEIKSSKGITLLYTR